MSSALKRIGFFKNRNKYVKAVQVPTATFSISESANETSATYTIDSNKPNITLYYSTGGSATPNDFTDNSITGNITLDANGNASLVRTINANNLGLARTFSTDVRINSTSGKIVYNGNTYNLLDNEMITTAPIYYQGPLKDYNYQQRVVYANITLDGVDYQQIQVMQNQPSLYFGTPQPTLDQFNIRLSPGKGPLGTALDAMVIAPGGGGGLANLDVLTGGGGGGGGQVIQQTLTFDNNQIGQIDVSLPKANLIVSDPANANTVISNLFTLSGSNPSTITALHGEIGEQGQLTKGGDGGFAGNSSSYSDPGSGAGGRTTNTLSYPYGAGPSEGANGTYSTDFKTLIYHKGDIGTAFTGPRYYVTQKSTSGSGTGAVFDISFPNELSEIGYIPNYNPSNVTVSFERGLDPMNQLPTYIGIQGQSYNVSGNAGIGYNVGDTVTFDGADMNGVTGTHDITCTIQNTFANGAIRHLEGGANANLNGISNITGGCPVIIWKEDITDNVTAYPYIVAPYTMTDPATFNANTAFNFFGGGGGVSKATLSGGIAYFGRGILGQGGKGEHFNNNGSNIDMYATDGAGGSVLFRWRRFAPFRTIQIS